MCPSIYRLSVIPLSVANSVGKKKSDGFTDKNYRRKYSVSIFPLVIVAYKVIFFKLPVIYRQIDSVYIPIGDSDIGNKFVPTL